MTDLGALPPALSLPAGGRAVLPLPSYAGSGNAWSARCLDGLGVADVRVQLGPATDEGYAVRPGSAHAPVEPPDAAPVPETLVVDGQEEGTAVWQLVLSRPFAPDVPTATHELQVTVRGHPDKAG